MRNILGDYPRLCPKCDKEAPLVNYKSVTLGCEDCGEHPGVICPNCEQEIDLIYEDFIHFQEVD